MIDGCRIGLALGGGAARGLAHIGVLKILEQNRIPIDLIAGTSIGALVGGVYATTRSAAATEKRFLEFIFSEEFKRARFDFLRESREASPDLLSSVIVARRGEGDMAVSSSIGSNCTPPGQRSPTTSG